MKLLAIGGMFGMAAISGIIPAYGIATIFSIIILFKGDN